MSDKPTVRVEVVRIEAGLLGNPHEWTEAAVRALAAQVSVPAVARTDSQRLDWLAQRGYRLIYWRNGNELAEIGKPTREALDDAARKSTGYGDPAFYEPPRVWPSEEARLREALAEVVACMDSGTFVPNAKIEEWRALAALPAPPDALGDLTERPSSSPEAADGDRAA